MPMPTPVKPADQHWLSGTKSQAKPEPQQEFEPGRPKFPRGITGDERVTFKRLVKLLESRRAVTEGDRELIRIYAITYARHDRALAKTAEQGEVVEYTRLNSNGEEVKVEKPNFHLKIAETCEKNLVAILDRLGLTPLNRAKVKPTAKPSNPATPSEFEQFMSGRSSTEWVMPPKNDEDGNHGEETTTECA
jgi:P27 family predicted phage terminase small subunit